MEELVVVGMVSISALYLGKTIYKNIKGSKNGCGGSCSSCSGCKHNKK